MGGDKELPASHLAWFGLIIYYHTKRKSKPSYCTIQFHSQLRAFVSLCCTAVPGRVGTMFATPYHVGRPLGSSSKCLENFLPFFQALVRFLVIKQRGIERITLAAHIQFTSERIRCTTSSNTVFNTVQLLHSSAFIYWPRSSITRGW